MAGQDPQSRARRVSFELLIGAVFLALTSLFAIEIHHYFQTGRWVLHGGVGGFANWAIERQYYSSIVVHSTLMLAWMGVVVHQLLTQGSGHHRRVGWIGVLGVAIGLVSSLYLTAVYDLPVLHGALGLSLMDLVMIITTIGIFEEAAIGIYKVRKGRIEQHRMHLSTSVLFTAGPGLYRVCVELLTTMFGQRGADASLWKTAWIHEFSLTTTLLTFLLLLFTRRLGGHLPVWRDPAAHDAVERIAARIMLPLCVGLIVLFSVFWVDCLIAWPGGDSVATRAEVGLFKLAAF